MKNFNNEISFKELMIHTSITLKNPNIQKTILSNTTKKTDIPLDKTTSNQECVNCCIF